MYGYRKFRQWVGMVLIFSHQLTEGRTNLTRESSGPKCTIASQWGPYQYF